MKVVVFKERCLGAGHCFGTAPEVFDQSDDGIVILLDPNPPEELRTAVEHAVHTCPGQAIAIEDDESESSENA